MASEKIDAGNLDRIRINVREDYDVRDWSSKFGITENRLKATVAMVGPRVGDVARALGKRPEEIMIERD
jgi:hypothetical protein